MGALVDLERIGLHARLTDNGRLQVGPPDRLTPELLVVVRGMATAIREELSALPPRFRAWQMLRDGKRCGVMVSQSMAGMDQHEALAAVPSPGITVQPMPASRVTG